MNRKMIIAVMVIGMAGWANAGGAIEQFGGAYTVKDVKVPAVSGAEPADDGYFRAKSVTVTSEEKVPVLSGRGGFPVPLRATKSAAAAIVGGGAQAWNVINSGAPNGSLSSCNASAIPGFAFNWADFSGWEKREVIYTYTVTNLMNIEVIKIKYEVSYLYNGRDLAARRKPNAPPGNMVQPSDAIKGHYIANFIVRPLSMSIKWGWKFSLNVSMSDPMNIGTSEAPVAYLQADLNSIISTPFSTNGGVLATYGVDGLGNFTDLTVHP